MNLQKKYDIFLSHNSKDKPIVSDIVSYLESRNVSCWYDATCILPGDVFTVAIENILPKVSTIVLCIGNNGIGQWQQKEYYVAVKLAKATHLRLIPILLPGFGTFPSELEFLSRYSWIQLTTLKDVSALEKIVSVIIAERTSAHPERELLHKGYEASKNEEYKTAVKYLTAAIKIASDWYSLFVLRGIALKKAGYLKEAIADLNQATTLNSEDPELFNFIGLMRQNNLNDKEGAIAYFNRAIAIAPNYADAHYNKAVAYLSSNTIAARESFQKAANLYLQQGDKEQYKIAIEGVDVLEAEGKSYFNKWMKGISIIGKDIFKK